MLTIGQQLNDSHKSDVTLSRLPNGHLLLRLTIIPPETTLTQDVTLSISFRHSLTPYVALSLAMKLREEFSPTPPHITLLIRVDNWLLSVCPQEEHRSRAVGEIR